MNVKRITVATAGDNDEPPIQERGQATLPDLELNKVASLIVGQKAFKL